MNLRPCGICNRMPAAGLASITRNGVETFYCHGDLDQEPTCYQRASAGQFPPSPTVLAKAMRDAAGIVTYIGRCCSEWVMAYGVPVGTCGLCGMVPEFVRFEEARW